MSDHLGSTRVLYDGSTTTSMRRDYYPYGATRTASGNNETAYQFTGKELDSQSGLSYFNARYYNSSIGRFLACDPCMDDYPTLSPYTYCANNPIKFIDPTGCTVELEDSTEAAELAAAINKENGSDVTITKGTKEVSSGWFGRDKTTVTVWYLSTEGTNYNWGQNEITSALYDVINTDQFTFEVKLNVEEYNGKPLGYNEKGDGYGGGYLDSNKHGGTIFLSPEGAYKVWESLGVRFMHEAVGHGHPITGMGYEGNATDINRVYNGRWERLGHGGCHTVLKWELTHLWYLCGPPVPPSLK